MSNSTTIRVSLGTRDRLRALAEARGSAMSQVIDEAVEAYRRTLFLCDLNEAYRQVRNDPTAWAEVREERAEWDAALDDGLENE